MKIFSKSFTLIGIASVMLTTSTMSLANTPPWVQIRDISYAGSGCPVGSVAENLASDYKAFTLLFDQYFAEVGPGVPYKEKRKNCQVIVDLDFPQGWSYTIFEVDYRGYVSLDNGVQGVQKSTYYFQGQRQTAPLSTSMWGPLDKDYHIRDTLGISALVWSPCGMNRALNINSQVRVDNRRNRNGFGLMTLDSLDGQLKHIYNVRWRRCW